MIWDHVEQFESDISHHPYYGRLAKQANAAVSNTAGKPYEFESRIYYYKQIIIKVELYV